MTPLFTLIALLLSILFSATLIAKKRSLYGLDFLLIFFCLYLVGGKIVQPAIQATFPSDMQQIVMLTCFYIIGATICLLLARALSKLIG